MIMDILIWDGDIAWQGDKIMLCDGVSNIVQQAYLETTTDKGESLFYQEYGTRIYQKIGRVIASGNKELVQQEIVAVFRDMPGVEVNSIAIEEVPLGWQVNVKFTSQEYGEQEESFVIGGEQYGMANKG